MGMYERENDRGPSFRGSPILIAFIIALFGLFSYFSHTEKNPITGEVQRISISPNEEIRLGLEAAPAMAREMGGELPASSPKTQEVIRIGNQIVQESEAKNGPWKFKFHLLADSKTINAFALPGGQIFITLGLLDRLQNEGQLAGVLAHEIGHVIQRHSAQQMAKGQLGQILVTAAGVGASDPNNPQQGYYGVAIANMVNQMTQLHYSRKDELEADQWGLKLMSEAGYNPKAMLEVMAILEKASPGGHQPEMLLTHPYPENRIKEINAYLAKHPQLLSLSEGRSLSEVYGGNEEGFMDLSH